MKKTELMKRFEEETGQTLEEAGERGITLNFYLKYIQWLEAKAEAYERIMSGGLSMKELANILKLPVAIDNDDNQDALHCFGLTPHIGMYSDGTQFWSCERKWRLPRQLVNFTGDWTTSLTLPDGWEEK